MHKKWHELLISARFQNYEAQLEVVSVRRRKFATAAFARPKTWCRALGLGITLENSHAAALSYSNRHHGGLIDSIH
jgi:hypothetical protein